MPVLGGLDITLGAHPLFRDAGAQLEGRDREALVSARNKLARNITDFTADELAALGAFIEDEELRTLHTRVDWLPRTEQLEVSALVEKLTSRFEKLYVNLGITNETALEDFPDGMPLPNPLPRDGIGPDPRDFPSSVRSIRAVRKPHAADPQEPVDVEVDFRARQADLVDALKKSLSKKSNLTGEQLEEISAHLKAALGE